MIILQALLFFGGLWGVVYATGQTWQLLFPAMPGDEPLPASYFQRHRRYIIKSAIIGYLAASGLWAIMMMI